tara:strand:+ start:649 stop:1017 length:369 start_codon:yes stop_codon:yes gene_type:complete
MDYRLKRVIDFFREEMVANAAGGSGGFSGSANAAGPVAGFDPVMGKKISRRKSIGRWSKSLQNKKKIKESLSTKDTKNLNKASALSQSDSPKDQDRARARRTEVDYKDLMRQIKAKKGNVVG